MKLVSLTIAWIATFLAVSTGSEATTSCSKTVEEVCPGLFDKLNRLLLAWNDENGWDIPTVGQHVDIPVGLNLILRPCHLLQSTSFEGVSVPKSSRLFITDSSILEHLGTISGEVEVLSQQDCARETIAKRYLASQPTKKPTVGIIASNAPTIQDTILSTSSPSASPTIEATIVEVGTANNAQAVRTLVGTTVPFAGLGALMLGVYMVRRRRSSSLKREQVLNTGSVISDKKDFGSPNPAFSGGNIDIEALVLGGAAVGVGASRYSQQQRDVAPLVRENAEESSTPYQATDLQSASHQNTASIPSDRRKTVNSVMAMVLKSRETPASYRSPSDETESGLSKEQIEQKIARMAAKSVMGFGTTTTSNALKPIGQRLSRFKQEGSEIISPSDVRRQDANISLGSAAITEELTISTDNIPPPPPTDPVPPFPREPKISVQISKPDPVPPFPREPKISVQTSKPDPMPPFPREPKISAQTSKPDPMPPFPREAKISAQPRPTAKPGLPPGFSISQLPKSALQSTPEDRPTQANLPLPARPESSNSEEEDAWDEESRRTSMASAMPASVGPRLSSVVQPNASRPASSMPSAGFRPSSTMMQSIASSGTRRSSLMAPSFPEELRPTSVMAPPLPEELRPISTMPTSSTERPTSNMPSTAPKVTLKPPQSSDAQSIPTRVSTMLQSIKPAVASQMSKAFRVIEEEANDSFHSMVQVPKSFEDKTEY